MLNSTLCYLERGDEYLMLHRVKKKNDVNHDKWIGVGGKFEDGESPEECVKREALEETGLTLLDPALRGIVTFVSDTWDTEYMFLYTCTAFTGSLTDCDEGVLEWVDQDRLESLNLWEGDKLMFRLLREREDYFSLKLRYQGDTLLGAEVFP